MTKKYTDEAYGQKEFYADYLPLIDKDLSFDEIKQDNSDGILNGNILEFKLIINDVNAVLFQAIKYLSSRRLKGKPVPANILLVSLNDEKIYHYYSQDFFDDIEKVYIGASSKGNTGFARNVKANVLDLTKQLDQGKLIKLLKNKEYMRINLDENNIVGWATYYYNLKPKATKGDFLGDDAGKVKIIGEIRKPEVLKEFILPYTKPTNIKFQYLMDKLNDWLKKKELGAFYTPLKYVEKSIELVRKAIDRVPTGNDYIILDRCAGTGNLEVMLSDEELSHVIISTYEYYEYQVLVERIGEKVRFIIPPIEQEDTFNQGLVRGSNALSKEFLDNDIVNQYVGDENCTIIIFENPPYAETTGIEFQRSSNSKNSTIWKDDYVVKEFVNEVKKDKNIAKSTTNEMGNSFIWSAFKYYLRQPTDSLIVFSPIKYWKSQHLIDKKFGGGFAFNRKHFHTNIKAVVTCLLWYNEPAENEMFEVEAYDLDKNQCLVHEGKLPLKKVHNIFSEVYYDNRNFQDDSDDGIACALSGIERNDDSVRVKKIFNENIIGYLVSNGVNFDNPDLNTTLLRCVQYNGNGFYLRRDNFMEKLPVFVAGRYVTYNPYWTERARIFKSADGANKYFSDVENGRAQDFLYKCLLFVSLTQHNHCRSIEGSDGRFYKNELCLDKTNGDTEATRAMQGYEYSEKEKEMVELFDSILSQAKATKNYNKDYTYGLFQIEKELNTFKTIEISGKNIKLFDYPELNGDIKAIKAKVKQYYLDNLVSYLFAYEFIK